MSFWDVIWFIIVSFGFIFYLMMLFSIIGDLFADHETGGGAKALWVVFLLIFPLLTALVYLIVRGDGMARRSLRSAARAQQQQEAYLRSVVGQTSPVEHIALAKQLLDSGAITPTEFDILKVKALS